MVWLRDRFPACSPSCPVLPMPDVIGRTHLFFSCLTGDMPFASGTVVEIKDLGQTRIATIEWNGEGGPPDKVNIANLSKVTDKGIQGLP